MRTGSPEPSVSAQGLFELLCAMKFAVAKRVKCQFPEGTDSDTRANILHAV